MTIRQARLANLQAIVKRNKEELNYDYSSPNVEKQLAYLLSSPASQLFVAEIAGDVVGDVQVSEYIATYAPLAVNIMAIMVANKYQRAGIGRSLMNQAEDWAKDRNANCVRLSSGEERTAAHQFYQQIGYKKVKTMLLF